jgi:capsule polysaccharide export protein KpsE/RkpR
MDLGAGTSPYQSQVENLQTKLNTLRSRYGPAHPDVRRLEAQLQQLKAKIVPAPDNSATASPVARQSHNPVVEAQLEKLDEDIAKKKASAAKVQNDIDFHISKIQREPIFWEKTAGVTRDYDTLRARYTSLLDKKLAADTASAMESRQKSERFVILDPAQVPEKPYSPNRPLLFLGGLIGGVLIGIGVVVVMEIMDESVRDGRQAERILGKPVLTGIPEILTSQQQWNGRVRLCAASLTTVVTAVILGLGIAHFSVRFF